MVVLNELEGCKTTLTCFEAEHAYCGLQAELKGDEFSNCDSIICIKFFGFFA